MKVMIKINILFARKTRQTTITSKVTDTLFMPFNAFNDARL